MKTKGEEVEADEDKGRRSESGCRLKKKGVEADEDEEGRSESG